MKNPLSMIGKETQKNLVGGLIGSLTYWTDKAIADSYTGYPTELKAKLIPQLPRNDELLTTIAPPVIMYAIGKKNAKVKEMANGTMLYSVPKLVDRIIVNAMGSSSATASMASRQVSSMPASVPSMPIPVQVANNVQGAKYGTPPLTKPAVMASMGKYQ